MEPKCLVLIFTLYTVTVLINCHKIPSKSTIALERLYTPSVDLDDPWMHKNSYLLNNKRCGISQSYGRIIGGTDAKLGQFPWIARLIADIKLFPGVSFFSCGGSIINERYILTAAHCVDKKKISRIEVGEHDIRTDPDCEEDNSGEEFCAPPVQSYYIEEITIHEDYRGKVEKFRNDIALIRVDEPIKFNDFVLPVCLETGSSIEDRYFHESGIAAGWGFFDPNASTQVSTGTSPVLQTVSIDIISTDECNDQLNGIIDVDDTQICGAILKGVDTCNGDSGGPFVKPLSIDGKSPRYYLIGLVSYGAGTCGQGNFPNMFTRVSSFLPWIMDHIHE